MKQINESSIYSVSQHGFIKKQDTVQKDKLWDFRKQQRQYPIDVSNSNTIKFRGFCLNIAW